MPAIKEYEARAVELRPSETGVESFQRAGYREKADYNEAGQRIGAGVGELGRGGEQIANAQQLQTTHAESTKLVADFAVLNANQNQGYNNAVRGTDPNDATVGQKWFASNYQPAAQKLLDEATTPEAKDLANRLLNSSTEHFQNIMQADRTERQNIAVGANWQTSMIGWSQQAEADPSSIPLIHQHIEQAKDAFFKANPNLSAVTAEKLSTEWTLKAHASADEAALKGILFGSGGRTPNPEQAAADLKAGMFKYVDGAQAAQAISSVNSALKSQATMDRMAGNQAREQGYRDTMANLYKTDVTPGPGGTVSYSPDFATHVLHAISTGRLPAEAGVSMIKDAQQQVDRAASGKVAPFDPAVLQKLNDSVDAGTYNSAAAFKAMHAGQLTLQQVQTADKEAKQIESDPHLQEGLKSLQGIITGLKPQFTSTNMFLPGHVDPAGDAAFGQAQAMMRQQFIKGYEAGKSPEQMLSPSSPLYIGAGLDPAAMKKAAALAMIQNSGVASPTPALGESGVTRLLHWISSIGSTPTSTPASPAAPVSTADSYDIIKKIGGGNK